MGKMDIVERAEVVGKSGLEAVEWDGVSRPRGEVRGHVQHQGLLDQVHGVGCRGVVAKVGQVGKVGAVQDPGTFRAGLLGLGFTLVSVRDFAVGHQVMIQVEHANDKRGLSRLAAGPSYGERSALG